MVLNTEFNVFSKTSFFPFTSTFISLHVNLEKISWELPNFFFFTLKCDWGLYGKSPQWGVKRSSISKDITPSHLKGASYSTPADWCCLFMRPCSHPSSPHIRLKLTEIGLCLYARNCQVYQGRKVQMWRLGGDLGNCVWNLHSKKPTSKASLFNIKLVVWSPKSGVITERSNRAKAANANTRSLRTVLRKRESGGNGAH